MNGHGGGLGNDRIIGGNGNGNPDAAPASEPGDGWFALRPDHLGNGQARFHIPAHSVEDTRRPL